jgi:RNA polymerase sigma-70 factor (ECF subfamily)
MIARVALGSLIFFCLLGADEPTKEAKKELELLQGDWVQVWSEVRGKRHTSMSEVSLTIKEDQWIVKLKNGMSKVEGDSVVKTKDGIEITSTIKIDPSQDPKAIDLKTTTGGKEKITLNIYKLDGDTLTVCKTVNGKERPTEFKTTKEEGLLAEYKRVKK